MRVLLFYVSTNMSRDGELWYYDEGLASVAACLAAAGHEPRLRMVQPGTCPRETLAWAMENGGEKTLIVFLTSMLFSAYGHDRPDAFSPVADLGRKTGFPTLMVGLHATLNAEDVILHPGVDMVGRGEMDEALIEICDAIEAGRPLTGIRNLWTKSNGLVHREALRPLVGDLNGLPLPTRDLLPWDQQANERDGILTVICTRGCPLDCPFCSNHVLRRLYEGNGPYVRTKSPTRVIREILAARTTMPELRAVFFHDDIFGMSQPWTEEFLALYSRQVNLPWGCNLVIDQVNEDFASKIARAGCRQVQIGIEHGDRHVRNEILQKGISDERIHEAVNILRRHGIAIKFFAMMGLPEESRERFLSSVRNFAGMGPDMIQIQVWEAHEGSDLQLADREASHIAGRHYDPRGDRRAWRLKFYFRYFHRYVAIFEVLARQGRFKLRHRLIRFLVKLSIRLPFAPELMLRRDWDGRPRRFARALAPLWARKVARRLIAPFPEEVLECERRLASVYREPEGEREDEPRTGWEAGFRIDQRGQSTPRRTEIISS